MATDTSTETLTRWEPRPAVAALLRAFAVIAPIAASVAFVHFVSQIIGPPSGSALRHVVWWVGLSAGATVVLIGIDRLTRIASDWRWSNQFFLRGVRCACM